MSPCQWRRSASTAVPEFVSVFIFSISFGTRQGTR